MAVATAITAARKRLAAAWSIAKLQRLHRPRLKPKPCVVSTSQTGRPGLPLLLPSTQGTTKVTLSVQPCGFSGPMSQARACRYMSGSAHRLANLDALSPMRSHRLPSSIDGIEAE